MATTTQITAPARTTSPLALWHLLSLDAPTVAALWTYFIARATHTAMPAALPISMFLAVWILYAADRLLDTRHLRTQRRLNEPDDLEARHLFHHRHRQPFLTLIPIAAVVIAALLPNLLPATLHVYLIEGLLLIGWFLLVHATRSRLPKEFVVGLYFAAATFTPAFVREPSHRQILLACAALFAALCTFNCFFIRVWERDARHTRPLVISAMLLTLISLSLAPRSGLATAIALSAALLLLLHRFRPALSRTHLRAAADVALLTPALMLPFVR